MKTIKELREYFECTQKQAIDLLAICTIGIQDGIVGAYQDGDFANSEKWVNDVGLDIAKLETELNVETNDIFNLYEEGHTDGLKQYEESKHYKDNEGEA